MSLQLYMLTMFSVLQQHVLRLLSLPFHKQGTQQAPCPAPELRSYQQPRCPLQAHDKHATAGTIRSTK